jgi:hypothetical protein
MFVRDSCSKQLDSDRLAAYVPETFIDVLSDWYAFDVGPISAAGSGDG